MGPGTRALRAVVALALLSCSFALAHVGGAGVLASDDGSAAALVVRASNGETSEMCVRFDEDEISGADLLERSGVDYVAEASGVGTALCSIEGRGCSKDDCFCEYPSFWGYWVRDPRDDRWRFSDTGAAERVVRHGAMDAWSFGKNGEPAPADVAFADVCGAGADTAVRASGDEEVATRAPGSAYAAFAGFVALLSAAAVALAIRRRRG